MKEKQKKQLLDKEFSLSSWAIDNKMTVYVTMLIILVAGVMAFVSMPREDFPEIIENKVYISTAYPGTPAEDVEKLVIKPIEEEIRGISGVIDVQSVSFNDYGMVILEFDDNIKLEVAKIEVKDKIDIVTAQGDWPTLDNGARVDPQVFDLNIAEETPILNINITGNYEVQQLKEFGEQLEDDIEELSEIKDVVIRGVDDKEVEIAIDAYKMSAAQVSFNDVIQSVQGDNKTISGGNIVHENQRTNIRVMGEINEPNQLLNVVVKNNGGTVYLRDIASISFKEKDQTTFARESGEPVVMLDVKKRSGQNMIEAAEKIRQLIKNAQETYLPQDIHISVANDQAPRTQNQVDDLINNIIFGVILVVGVLMFFLGLRNASFVGMAIPLSMLMALAFLQMFGYTMNTMVLFGLVMGLGMLVDNGIVVVENVYTLINSGMDKKLAAKQGVGEIAWPIIASTATTLAAFFPLGLWPGTMGKFMIFFPLTLSFVLFSSLFVALVINSMLTSEFMKGEFEETKKRSKKQLIYLSVGLALLGIILIVLSYTLKAAAIRVLGNLLVFTSIMLWVYRLWLKPASNYFQNKSLPALEERYRKFLTWGLKGWKPVFLVIGVVILFILSNMLLSIFPRQTLFFPDTFPNQIITYIEYPEGTDIQKTNEVTKEVEKRVAKVLDKYTIKKDGEDYNFMAENIVSQVGQGANNPQTDAGSSADIPHKGKITVSLREFKFRQDKDGNIVNSKDVLSDVRHSVKTIPGVSISVESEPVGPPSGYPINIEIQGKDYHVMMDEAERLIDFINETGVEGIEGLRVDVSRNNPELQLEVDEELAGSMGVSNTMVGSVLRQSIYGWEASRYKPKGDDDDYPINVRLQEDQRYNESVLFNQPITFRNPATGQLMQIPISGVTQQVKTKQFSQIKRKDFKRTITVYSNVLKEEGYNATEVVNRVKDKLSHANYELPKGYTYKFTGEQEEQEKQFSFLIKALLIAVAGITLIIVMQFNSVSKPIIIMTAVLLSFIGVFLGMILFGDDFVILMTMMGIISLAGIVVNNAIVLIDYTQLLIDRKKQELNLDEKLMLPIIEMKKAVIAGGKSRLRPVLLTAITTILGLVPLAYGVNIDFFSLFTDYNPKIYIGGDNVAFWGPLAKTVIYGLVFATFLTLVIVPVLQYLINRLKFRVRYGKKGINYPK